MLIFGLIILIVGIICLIAGVCFLKNPEKYAKESKEKRTKGSIRAYGISYFIFGAIMIPMSIYLMHDSITSFFDMPSNGEYETNYIDDNGNGQLDQGEWNYTLDEDGNVVDIDDDGSNFE